MATFDRRKIYTKASDYFWFKENISGFGSGQMKLIRSAAFEACKQAYKHNLLILGVDCGINVQPGYCEDYNAQWSFSWDISSEEKDDLLKPEGCRLEALKHNNNRAAKAVMDRDQYFDPLLIQGKHKLLESVLNRDQKFDVFILTSHRVIIKE